MASNARIDVRDTGGAHTVVDPSASTVGIDGSSAFIDGLDDDDAPFEVDDSRFPSVSLAVDGRSYTAVITSLAPGAVTIQFQTSTPAGTSLPTSYTTSVSASVPLTLDLVAGIGGMQSMPSATGLVTINRSCGSAHMVTNSNGLALDLTYTVQGSTVQGPPCRGPPCRGPPCRGPPSRARCISRAGRPMPRGAPRS